MIKVPQSYFLVFFYFIQVAILSLLTAVQCSVLTLIKSEADCRACNQVRVANSATPTNILQWDGSACVEFVRGEYDTSMGKGQEAI